jgi:tRNA threonylcarbamoyladenosine biosynthesis protein TsaB
MLLAIDTATQHMSLALHDGRSVLAEQTWFSGNNHTIALAPTVRQMLMANGLSVEALRALAVSVGPGSYSGLRIGVALAKGMAAARSLPLVGVSSLDTLAAGTPYLNGGLVVALPAGRGRLIVKTYRWRKGRWGSHKSEEPELMDWQALMEKVDGAAFLTGEISEEGFETIKAAQANGVPLTIVAGAYRLRRAGFLAEEAWTRLNENSDPKVFEAARVVPFYVKTKDIPG